LSYVDEGEGVPIVMVQRSTIPRTCVASSSSTPGCGRGRGTGEWSGSAGSSVRVMLRHAIADHRRYTRGTERHYLKALDGYATWVYAREVLGSSVWYDGLWRQRDRIARIPALLIWGMKDRAFGRHLGRWREVFERAEVVELPDCGHALTEERAPEALKRLAPFLEP